MKFKLAAVICIFTMLVSSTAFAYSRGSQGYGEIPAEETDVGAQTQAEPDEEPYQDIQETEEMPEVPGMSGTQIGGYVLITLGGLAAIAGVSGASSPSGIHAPSPQVPPRNSPVTPSRRW